MAEKNIEKKVVREVEDIVESQTICDGCGKVIFAFKPHVKRYRQGNLISWYKVFRGHNDWGNDSIDSFEHEDYCNDCIDKAFEDYIERSKDKRNTEFFELRHCYCYKHIIDKAEDNA